MTREGFIEILDEKEYSYRIDGDKIIVTSISGEVWLSDLTSLPSGVEFRNEDHVCLDSLTSLPSDVVFNNGDYVSLESLTSLPSGVVFKNKGNIWLGSLTGWFYEWNGNIEGIESKRLLNFMISKGLFER
jgi:hypothetical protein